MYSMASIAIPDDMDLRYGVLYRLCQPGSGLHSQCQHHGICIDDFDGAIFTRHSDAVFSDFREPEFCSRSDQM